MDVKKVLSFHGAGHSYETAGLSSDSVSGKQVDLLNMKRNDMFVNVAGISLGRFMQCAVN